MTRLPVPTVGAVYVHERVTRTAKIIREVREVVEVIRHRDGEPSIIVYRAGKKRTLGRCRWIWREEAPGRQLSWVEWMVWARRDDGAKP